MLSEGIGRDLGIQYSKRSHPYSHVDPSTIFYISRDGVLKEKLSLRLFRDMNNWVKGIGGEIYGPEDTV